MRLLHERTRLTGKIRGHFSAAVRAHRMHRVAVQRAHSRVAVPKAQRAQPRIDVPFARLLRLLARRAAESSVRHRAGARDEAPVARDAIHLRAARAEMRDAPRVAEALAHRGGDARDARVVEFRLAHGCDLDRRLWIGWWDIFPRARRLHVAQKLLRVLIHHRRIVDVRGRDEHTLRFRARGFGERAFPFFKRSPADFAPVERDHHERLLRARQHEALRKERIGDRLRRRDAAAHARMADRDRHIHGERGDLETSGPRGKHSEEEEQREKSGDAQDWGGHGTGLSLFETTPQARVPDTVRAGTRACPEVTLHLAARPFAPLPSTPPDERGKER